MIITFYVNGNIIALTETTLECLIHFINNVEMLRNQYSTQKLHFCEIFCFVNNVEKLLDVL
jgi:hypothetical protein